MNQSLPMNTLWNLKKGESCVLTGFDGELDPQYQERILELGFRPQSLVTCLKHSSFGAPRVYQVNNSVFCLEDSIASCIFVEPVKKSL